MEKNFTKETPVYRQTREYASENNELEQFRESYHANIACKEAIQKAIGKNYDGMRLNVQEVIETVTPLFSMERIQYVLANTIQYKAWDERFSPTNRQWAESIPVTQCPDTWGNNRNCYFAVDSHSGLTNLFVTHFRKELEKGVQEKKPSILNKLSQPLPETKSKSDKPKAKEPEL